MVLAFLSVETHRDGLLSNFLALNYSLTIEIFILILGDSAPAKITGTDRHQQINHPGNQNYRRAGR